MIIALASLLFLLIGGDSLHFHLVNIEKPVKEAVHDQARRKAVIEESQALAEDLQILEEQINLDFEAFVKVHAEYDSMATDFDAATTKLQEHQWQATRLTLDAREAMHGNMTRQEWESVFK